MPGRIMHGTNSAIILVESFYLNGHTFGGPRFGGFLAFASERLRSWLSLC